MTKILPILYGNVYNKRLTAFYTAIYFKRFGQYPKINFLPYYCMLKRVFVKYGEIKVAGAILMHFEQNGEKIIAEKFPIMWLEKNVDRYLSQLQEYHDINTEDEKALYEAVKNRLNYLEIDYKL